MRVHLAIHKHARRALAFEETLRSAFARRGITIVDGGRVDAVVAAGGDGTIAHALAKALARDVPLGIIPLGTFNELARTLAIPEPVEAAVAVIAEGSTRRIDVATVNGVFFVNEASIGVSSRVTRMQTPELKQRFGLVGVAFTAFSAFRHARPIHASVHDEAENVERFRTIQLTIANSHRFGGFLNVADAAIDDGLLDLYSVDIQTPWEAFRIAQAMFAGKPRDVPGLKTMRARQFTLRTRHAHHITADGEPAGKTPATFSVLPKALRVFVPA